MCFWVHAAKGIPYLVTVRAHTSAGTGENASMVVFSGELGMSRAPCDRNHVNFMILIPD